MTTLYNRAQLETPWEITSGGAVPLGHPYGMSGIRYLGSTLLELARRRRHRAIVGVCTAGGMSTAAYLERPYLTKEIVRRWDGADRLMSLLSQGGRFPCAAVALSQHA